MNHGKKIRIMHVVAILGVGGMEKGVLTLLNNIDRNMFVPFVCSLNPSQQDFRKKFKDDVTIIDLNKKKSGVDYSLILQLASIFRKNKIDIVHSHNWAAYFYTVAAAVITNVTSNIKIIHGEHGKNHFDLNISNKRLIISRLLALFTKKIIAVAEDIETEILQTWRVPRNKVVLIKNGVTDLSRKREDNAPNQPAADAGFSPNRSAISTVATFSRTHFIIGTIARFSPIKSLETAIMAFHNILKQFPDSILALAGYGEEEINLKRLTTELKINSNVLFTGKLDNENIADLLNLFDLYINTSLYEGMSNTLLEAMSASKAVVATDVGGTKELVKNGFNGFLFEPKNVNQLSFHITHLIQNRELLKQLGANGKEYVEKNHSVSKMIKDNEEIYKNAIFKTFKT